MSDKIENDLWLNLYRNMLLSRRSEEVEKSLAQQGEIFFYVPGAGHEAAAALAAHLSGDDWLSLHYRDRALALARGVSVRECFCCAYGKQESSSSGRRMPGFISDRELKILSGSTVVGNSALQAVGIAARIKDDPEHPLVVCSVGDGSTQQGEFLEAIAEAVRSRLPVLFLIQDNKYALSTPTKGKTFYSTPGGDADQFYGLPIKRVNGIDPIEAHRDFGDIVESMRAAGGPRLLLLQVERLSSHTNADDESVYRDAEEIARLKAECDPITRLRERLLEMGVTEDALEQIAEEVEQSVAAALAEARAGSEPVAEHSAKKPLAPE